MKALDRLLASGQSSHNEHSTDAQSVGTALFETRTGPSPWSLFIPLHYEPNYAYPLLVWLHGPRDNERQLKRIMPLVSMRNYAAIAPGDRSGGELTPSDVWPQTAQSTDRAVQLVYEAIERAGRKLNISRKRVFLGGFDAGGTMALRVGMANAEHFAGVVSLGGAMPRGDAPLAGINQARRLPVLLASGKESQRYSSSTICDDLRLLHAAGIQVALRLYPGGHQISPDMLADVDRWMMEIITGECT